jgi:hypothetical protein
MYLSIPTYDVKTESWSHTDFETKEAYVEFLWSIFKEPGKYEFDETSLLFNAEARKFNKFRLFCTAPLRS